MKQLSSISHDEGLLRSKFEAELKVLEAKFVAQYDTVQEYKKKYKYIESEALTEIYSLVKDHKDYHKISLFKNTRIVFTMKSRLTSSCESIKYDVERLMPVTVNVKPLNENMYGEYTRMELKIAKKALRKR